MPFVSRSNILANVRKETKVLPGSVIPKLEGTSQTYGQLIRQSPPKLPQVNSALTNSTVKQSAKTAEIQVSPRESSVKRSPKYVGKPRLETPPVKIPNSKVVDFLTQARVNTKDTIVKVIRNSKDVEVALAAFGTIPTLPCKAVSNVATAAALGQDSATVVLPRERLVEKKQEGLFGQFLTSFTNVTPNVVEHLVVAGSSIKTKEEQASSLRESQKIDLTITLKSKPSEDLEFNNLKVPDLEVEFFYNFFVEDEEDIEEQEDRSKDPLLKRRPVDTPRYVSLQWSTAKTTEPLQVNAKNRLLSKEERRGFYSNPRGVASSKSKNFRNSSEKSKKKIRPIVKDGLTQESVDIHDLEVGFNSVSNDKVFANSVKTTFNISEQNDNIEFVPIKSISKFV